MPRYPTSSTTLTQQVESLSGESSYVRATSPRRRKHKSLNFIPEWIELQTLGLPDMSGSWTMYFDGSKRVEGAGADIVLILPKGDKMGYVLRMNFRNASNNKAEYEALLHEICMAKACGATCLVIYGDSNLVIQHTMKKCDAVNNNKIAYRDMYNLLKGSFDGYELNHIPPLQQ
jgi:hypothetical protein